MTNQDAAKFEERFVDVASSFVAYPQATGLMKPTIGAFHNPSIHTQATAMLRVSTSDLRGDASCPQGDAMCV